MSKEAARLRNVTHLEARPVVHMSGGRTGFHGNVDAIRVSNM